MIVQPISNLIICRPNLAAFETHDDIGGQTVHEVAEVSGIRAGISKPEVHIAIHLLAAVEIESEASGDRDAHLRPTTVAADGNDLSVGQHGKSRRKSP